MKYKGEDKSFTKEEVQIKYSMPPKTEIALGSVMNVAKNSVGRCHE